MNIEESISSSLNYLESNHLHRLRKLIFLPIRIWTLLILLIRGGAGMSPSVQKWNKWPRFGKSRKQHLGCFFAWTRFRFSSPCYLSIYWWLKASSANGEKWDGLPHPRLVVGRDILRLLGIWSVWYDTKLHLNLKKDDVDSCWSQLVKLLLRSNPVLSTPHIHGKVMVCIVFWM